MTVFSIDCKVSKYWNINMVLMGNRPNIGRKEMKKHCGFLREGGEDRGRIGLVHAQLSMEMKDVHRLPVSSYTLHIRTWERSDFRKHRSYFYKAD